MLLCEGTAVVLDMVRPKAQLLLAACESEWGTRLGVGRPWRAPLGPQRRLGVPTFPSL